MTEYIKLTEAPMWVIQYPQCGACMVDLYTDGDGWLCEVCGTTWDMRANDGDPGTLFENWSGEVLDVEPSTHREAMTAGIRYEREQRERSLARWLSSTTETIDVPETQ